MFPALRQRLKRGKNDSIPYDVFIQYALYDEEDGYYNQDQAKIGKNGDFYTSSHIHQVFSQVLANYFLNIAQSSEIPLHICEMGAGDGRFAKGVCEYFEDLGVSYKYDAVDISSDHRNKTSLNMGGVRIFPCLEAWSVEREHFQGIIFSNEWLDAQPVKVVTKQEDEVYEVWVRLQEDDTLEEVYYPCSIELEKWMGSYDYDLEEGQRLELPVYMEELLSQLEDRLVKGVIVTVDYGFTSEELKHPSRLSGSLRGYFQHQMKENVLEQPGSMDITHHVHWDTWMKIGEYYGLHTSLLKQKDFLLEAGILNFLTEHASQNPFSEEHKLNRAIRSFIMGDQIANAFEVCVQEKGLDSTE